MPQGQVQITDLPQALALTGTESVPIVQNGVTVQTTTGAISGAGALSYPFLTVGTTAGLTDARYLTANSGLSLTDSGPGTTLQINLTGAVLSLLSSGTGLQIKTGPNTLTGRQIAVGGGMTIADADGVAGNPTIGLNTNLQNLAGLSGTGLVTISGSTFGQTSILGTTSQIDVANGNASGGSPTVSIASNPVLPGTGSVVLPQGTTAQRSASTYGAIRYNTETSSLEAYTSLGWGGIVSGAGVSNFSAGTTGLTPNTPTTGGIVLGGILNVANGGTGASTASGARANLSAAVLGANNDITSMTGLTGGISTPDFVQLDTAAAASIALAKLRWNVDTATAAFGIIDGTQEVQIGQQMYAQVTNADSVTITRGQVVYLYGATGNRASVKLASNVGDPSSAKTLGLVVETIAPNQIGFVITQGVLDKLDTSAFTAGDTVYLGVTPGSLTSTKPYAPNHLVYIGVVERANAGNGQIYVKPQNGYELEELHDVQILSPTTGQTIVYDSTTSLWKNSNAPVLSGATGLPLSTGVTGTLAAGNGGTGLTSYAVGDLLYATATTTLSKLGIGTNGYILTSSGTAPQWTAASSISVSTATNLAGGTAGALPYQTGAGATTFLSLGTTNYVLTAGASAPQYVAQSTLSVGSATNATNTGITSNSTNATNYLTFVSATTGNLPQLVNSSITCNPSTGQITGGIAGGAF